jgi:hypothetical protein
VSPGVITLMNPGPYWPLYLWGPRVGTREGPTNRPLPRGSSSHPMRRWSPHLRINAIGGSSALVGRLLWIATTWLIANGQRASAWLVCASRILVWRLRVSQKRSMRPLRWGATLELSQQVEPLPRILYDVAQ